MTKKQPTIYNAAMAVAAITFATAAWADNDIVFDQAGTDNTVYITQVGNNSISGNVNSNALRLSIDQEGHQNFSSVRIHNPTATQYSDVSTHQYGNHNTLLFDSGALSIIGGVVEQRGDQNRLEINQGDSVYLMNIEQDGLANDLTLNQQIEHGVATVLQQGDHLESTITQTVHGAETRLMQFGTHNVTSIQQDGRNALVDLVQGGQNNKLFVHQR